MFLLRKQAIEIENGVTDGTLLTLYHGTSPETSWV